MTSQTKIRTVMLGLAVGLILSACMTSCVSTGSTSSSRGAAKTLPASRMKSNAVLKRNQVIALEQPGNHYIGRRWYTDGTRYWGYLRKPGRPWAESRLVVMNETLSLQPDRVEETPMDGGRAHGYDHNYEYMIWGDFTGKVLYDPNSNLELPEFRLRKYKLINQNPGFLFYPGEPYQRRGLPPKHPPTL